MKKIFILFLFCFNALVFASDDGQEACLNFKITIKNNTEFTCYIIQQIIKTGSTYYLNEVNTYQNSDIPYRILAGEEKKFTLTQAKVIEGIDIITTYECGEDRFVTIESQKNRCMSGGAITGIISSMSNMNASYTSTEGDYWKKISGTINWTLY